MSAGGREQWSGRLGFGLAAVGSAVGLGNMWRFPYLAAENGGAAFLALYLAANVLIGLPLLLAEMAIGRGARRAPIGALTHFGGSAWRPLGWLFVATGAAILAYYSVIGGWTVRYALEAIARGFAGDAAARFGEASSGAGAVAWHLVFLAATVGVVASGVRRGIEGAALVLMPALFAIVAGLALYAASAGYAYYLAPSAAELARPGAWSDAAGQAFFSLSLGMGAILTYASYLDRRHSLPGAALAIAGADFAVAFAAGLVVFPLLFALGLQSEVAESTIGALFITLPHAFDAMGAAGRVVGGLFFVALAVGALTSAVSLLEVVVASALEAFGWTRVRGSVALGTAIAVLGVPAALDLDVLGRMDDLAGSVLLVAGGLATSLFVGWAMPDPVAEAGAGAGAPRWLPLWRWLLRWIAPAPLAVLLVLALRSLLA
jgi:NSS family neurotransmitter:Na+ symporter